MEKLIRDSGERRMREKPFDMQLRGESKCRFSWKKTTGIAQCS